MALYAHAMCSAQILERELVQVLAFLRTKTGELKEKNFDWAYEKMMHDKPSDLLIWIQGSGGNLPQDSQDRIRKALFERNFLAHGFFHSYSPVMSAPQTKRIATKLQKIDADLTAAFNLLQPLRLKLEGQLGLSAVRQSVREDFRKTFIEAVASFDDGDE